MSLQNLVFYLAAALLVTVSPGPDILTVITRSIAQGVLAGLVATLGFATGLIFHTTVAATGLALVLQQSPLAFRMIQLGGAGYLTWLGVNMIAQNKPLALAELPPLQLRRIFQQSIVMNVLNPKVTLFFVAFLSKFVEKDSPVPAWMQLVVMGALFAGCTLVCFGSCAVLAGGLAKNLRQRPRTGQMMVRAAGCVFLLLAVLIVWD